MKVGTRLKLNFLAGLLVGLILGSIALQLLFLRITRKMQFNYLGKKYFLQQEDTSYKSMYFK